MNIKISKQDIIWNYLGNILNIGVSILILPFVLKYLSSNELGIWYVFISIETLILLLDFGFSPSITRNIVYAWIGVTEIVSEGTPELNSDGNFKPNIRLIHTIIFSSKKIYLYISVFSAILILLIGTPYINLIARSDTKNILVAWGIFSIGLIINFYNSYWSPILKGIGAIKKSNQILLISKVIYLIFSIIGLSFGGGIVSISFVYFISGFLKNTLSKKHFKRISHIDYNINIDKEEVKKIFLTIWPNSKKQGIVSVGSWLITRSTTLIISYYFSLEITAQYGLSLQVLSVIFGISSLMFNSYNTEIIATKASKSHVRFLEIFGRSIVFQWIFGIIGSISVILVVPFLLKYLNSNSTLLSTNHLFLLSLILLLESNHSTFATTITLTNKVPFVKASIYSGLAIVLLSLISIYYTNLGIAGLLLSQGLIQLMYNNWYWPYYVCKENRTNFVQLWVYGINDYFKYFKILIEKIVN